MVDVKTDKPQVPDPFALKIRYQGDVFAALHFDAHNEAFPPTRNKVLAEAWKKIQTELHGPEIFLELVKDNLETAGEQMSEGFTILRDVSTRGYRAPFNPDVRMDLSPQVQNRSLWWNIYAKGVFEQKGVEGLIDDPSNICLALGMGQWLDAGNVFAEPRYVGDSLRYPQRPNLDLYATFGVTPETVVIFPHIKHWNLYRKPYNYLLHSQKMSEIAAYDSFKEIQKLMFMNKLNNLVVQGTWFLDPALTDETSPVYSEGFSWIRAIVGRVVEIGKADDINPTLKDFALVASSKRKKAYDAGTYIPKVYAAAITFGELSDSLSRLGNDLAPGPNQK